MAWHENRPDVLFQLSSPAEHPYGSKGTGSHYQGQRGPTPSRSYENFYRAHIDD